jgi:hypothetical protein
MQTMFHASSIRLGFWAVVLIGVGPVSMLILGIASFRQSRRWHLMREWRSCGKGNVFQGPTEWAEIN